MRHAGKDSLDPVKISRVCRLLGWTTERLSVSMKDCKTAADAVAALEQIKAEVKPMYRLGLRAFHPDHGGSADDLRHLNAVWQSIKDKKVVVRRPPPRPPRRVVAATSEFYNGGHGVTASQYAQGLVWGTTASTSSTTAGGFSDSYVWKR